MLLNFEEFTLDIQFSVVKLKYSLFISLSTYVSFLKNFLPSDPYMYVPSTVDSPIVVSTLAGKQSAVRLVSSMSVNVNVQISTFDSEFAIKPDSVNAGSPYSEVMALPIFFMYSCETPPSVQAFAANCDPVMSIDNAVVVTPLSASLLKCQFLPTKVSSLKSMV